MTPLPLAFLAAPIAHRALHGAGRPENSIEAVRAAVAAGYAIEIDIQPAGCGTPMVFHDQRLDRLTASKGPVSAHRADALAAMTLRGGASGIPRLTEVLEAVDGRVPLVIEIKDQSGALGPENGGGLEAAVARDLSGYAGPVAVMSFNPHVVLRLAELAPDLPRGLVGCGPRVASYLKVPRSVWPALRGYPDAARAAAGFVSHNHRDLAHKGLTALRAEGRAILCWTIRSQAEEGAARHHADNVTFEGYAAALPA